jgi:hypothetical protein
VLPGVHASAISGLSVGAFGSDGATGAPTQGARLPWPRPHRVSAVSNRLVFPFGFRPPRPSQSLRRAKDTRLHRRRAAAQTVPADRSQGPSRPCQSPALLP